MHPLAYVDALSDSDSSAAKQQAGSGLPESDREDLRWLVGLRLAEIERHAILQTLAACHGNRTGAARMLGISEKTIYNKLKQYRKLAATGRERLNSAE